jgi:hypothetical protein
MTESTESYGPEMRAKMNSYQFLVTASDGQEKIIANWEQVEPKKEKDNEQP